MNNFTHVDNQGEINMVDINNKQINKREAVAQAKIKLQPTTFHLIKQNQVKKGDVLATAKIAGIIASKKTQDLIPLCHQIPLEKVNIKFDFDNKNSYINIEASAKTSAKTGVEMEALTAVTVCALTLYDMCKSIEKGIQITNISLVKKTGGKSEDWIKNEN